MAWHGQAAELGIALIKADVEQALHAAAEEAGGDAVAAAAQNNEAETKTERDSANCSYGLVLVAPSQQLHEKRQQQPGGVHGVVLALGDQHQR